MGFRFREGFTAGWFCFETLPNTQLALLVPGSLGFGLLWLVVVLRFEFLKLVCVLEIRLIYKPAPSMRSEPFRESHSYVLMLSAVGSPPPPFPGGGVLPLINPGV